MAIYHLSVKPISRSGGRSATAAAAYRAAERVEDHTSGEVFDYTRKRGVEHTEIVLPTAAAKRDINWARDRTALWNEAERAEKRSDSRVAREYEVALPHELTKEQRLELTREFSQEIANRFGCAVDFAIHKPHRSGDERNHHAHILTTTREVGTSGLGAKTDIELKDSDRAKKGLGPAKQEVTAIRERWAQLSNDYLAHAGSKARIDHRSLEEQGVDREPTIHLGPAVSGMQRRGMDTEVGRRVELEAQARLERAAELGKVAAELREVESSIISLSTDIRAALSERDRLLSTRPTLAEERAKSRDAWLELRKGTGKAPGAESERGREIALPDEQGSKGRSKDRSSGKDDDFSR